MYNFARGHPNSNLVPLQEMQELFLRLSSRRRDPDNESSSSIEEGESSRSQLQLLQHALNYGQDEGEPELLKELVDFLERHCRDDDLGVETNGSSSNRSSTQKLFVTGGVSHGLELLAATQTSPGDVVLVERPTYYLIRAILKSHQLQIESLPMHSETGGVDVDGLQHLLETQQITPPRMIYIIPTHQNPTGRTMSIRDRRKLADLAHRFGFVVAADEVYHLLDWRETETDGPRPARMAVLNHEQQMDNNNNDKRGGCCVSVSSFTKIFSPGVRCGWIEGPPKIIQSLIDYGYIQSQGGCLPLMGEIMRQALVDRTVDRVLAQLVTAYRERSQLLCDRIAQEPRIQMPIRPCGGYFLWIQFPPELDVSDFLDYCAPHVRFMPGTRCSAQETAQHLQPVSLSSHARLCFADMDVDALQAGAELLLSKFRAYMEIPREL